MRRKDSEAGGAVGERGISNKSQEIKARKQRVSEGTEDKQVSVKRKEGRVAEECRGERKDKGEFLQGLAFYVRSRTAGTGSMVK